MLTAPANSEEFCWVFDYDTATYKPCSEQNLTLNAAWEEFYDAPTWVERES